MDRLDAMRMFVRVVESGSFSIVARELNVGQPAISKQVAALETHLGAQLLRRTSRGLNLTDAGQDFYESALRIIGDLDAAESRVGRGQLVPSGLVRIGVAPAFGRLYIVPRLQQFFARYPDVEVEVLAADRNFNLIEEGIDVAIRNGEVSDSTLMVRRLALNGIVTVGTPAYLERHGEPSAPVDLERHARVIFVQQGMPRPWRLRDASGPIIHPPKGPFRTNDAEHIRGAVLANLGLAYAPGWLFAAEIASGEVRRVLTEFMPEPLAISAVYAGDRRLPSKTRVFIEFMAAALADDSGITV
jgi:DNA-binding transcriptional LysR family regulator